MAILTNTPNADGVSLAASKPTRLLIIAGKPLNEPIVQHGPFVMNTQQEILEAIEDFQSGRLVS